MSTPSLGPSVIQPLSNKVAIFTSHIGTIVIGLGNGDPEAKKQVQALWKDLSNFYQDCSSGYAQVNASYNHSVAAAQSSSNPTPLIKIISYYIGEVIAAIQLVSNLIKLIASLISISTIIEYFTSDLLAAQRYLNTKALWLTRSIARAKQKLSKNIEWQKRIISDNLEIEYYIAQEQQYNILLNQLQSQLPPAQTPMAGVNGYYGSDGTFVYYNTTLNPAVVNALNQTTPTNSLTTGTFSSISGATNSLNTTTATQLISNIPALPDSQTTDIQNQIEGIKAQLIEINNNLDAAQYDLSTGIPNEKEYYSNLWATQQKQDDEQLLYNTPGIRTSV